jgi:ABC-2 type transport system ATP-binding protein
MDEAQYLADRVAVVARGRVIAEGTPNSLGKRDRAQASVRFRLPGGTALPAGLGAAIEADGYFELRAEQPEALLYRLTGWALENGIVLEGLEVRRPTLEDVYLTLTSDTPQGGDR